MSVRGCDASYRKKTIAAGARTIALKHGELTVTFKLSNRAAAHVKIRVSAQFFHQTAVHSTLLRQTTR